MEGVQRLPPGIELLHQCKGLGGGHQLLQFTGQNAQGLTPALGRVLGGHGHSCLLYTSLRNEYERGVDTQQLDVFFDTLRKGLVPLIRAIGEKPQIDDRCV